MFNYVVNVFNSFSMFLTITVSKIFHQTIFIIKWHLINIERNQYSDDPHFTDFLVSDDAGKIASDDSGSNDSGWHRLR